jgi:O-antigen/teichoic acid export membrane protein
VTLTVTPSARAKLLSFLQGSAGLAVAIIVMNVATYGFQLVAARRLGPEAYGGVASLMALLMVIGVVQLGLQATAARRVAAEPEHVGTIERVMRTVTLRASLATGAVMLLLSPVVWQVLKLDSLLPAVLIAVSAVPLTMSGGQAGILQGERRWTELSLLYLALGVPRVLVGVVCMVISPTETSAMIGVTLAMFAPAIVGWWALRHQRDDLDDRVTAAQSHDHGRRAVVQEIFQSSLALLAFFLLSNLDIVIARNTLSHHQAGLYAGGLILTKAVLFLPQVVVIIAFPSMSTEGEQRSSLLRALAAVAVAGVISIAGAWLLSGIAMIFIGGDSYSSVQHRLWLFAVVGMMLSLLQMLIYSVLARRHRGASILVWIAVAMLVALGLMASTLTGLVLTVMAVDTALTAVLLVLSLWHLRHEAPSPA